MRRVLLATVACAALLPAPGHTQQDPATLAARCNQLYAFADRALTRRGEGNGGPNMIVQGAGVDCQRGRYEQGIRDLERVLRSQGFTVPPPA